MIFFGHWPCLLRRRFCIRFRNMSQKKSNKGLWRFPRSFWIGSKEAKWERKFSNQIVGRFWISSHISEPNEVCLQHTALASWGYHPSLFSFSYVASRCVVSTTLFCVFQGFLRSAVAFECCGARAPFKQDIRIKCSIRDAVCSYICSYICLLPGFVVKCQYLFDM